MAQRIHAASGTLLKSGSRDGVGGGGSAGGGALDCV
jgi:hypothetical protein